MKTSALVSLLIVTSGVIASHAETFTFSGINAPIPDGNASGLSNTQTVTTSITEIASLTLGLNLSGTFSGDIYAYIKYNNVAGTLLNRTGRTATDSFGYDDDGFQVIFSDSASDDIHNYRAVITPSPGSPLTGTWQPDARTADPDMVTEASPRSSFLSSFNGMNPNGNWTLFVADLSGGDLHTLNSWSLDITPVPEAGTWIVPALLLAGLGVSRQRRRFQTGKQSSG